MRSYVRSPHVREIPPVIGDHRPKWSVMIPTYNSNDYLGETIESILVQDQGRDQMQIEVVDDASPNDDTVGFVEKHFGDRIDCYVQSKNLGLIGNFTDCIARSKGKYVHILHGDDKVEDGFYLENEKVYDTDESIGAVISRTEYINGDGSYRTTGPTLQEESGLAPNFKEAYFTYFGVNTPAVTVRRDVYEHLGGFDSRIKNLGEDREMWSRIARWYEIGYQIKPLAVYRIHEMSLSEKITKNGSIYNDIMMSNDICLEQYKGTDFEHYFQANKKKIARNAQISAISALKQGRVEVFLKLIKRSLNYYPSILHPYWLTRALIDRNYK